MRKREKQFAAAGLGAAFVLGFVALQAVSGPGCYSKHTSSNSFFSGPSSLLDGYYSCNEVKRGEVVSYNHTGLEENLIVQVKAVPGDRMSLAGCRIVVNNETIETYDGETYCVEGKRRQLLSLYSGDISGYLVLANNASGGYDSTRYGLVSKNKFDGRINKQGLF